MNSRTILFGFMLLASVSGQAAVYRMLTGDYTTINPDWSAYENGWSFDTVESGSPSQPLVSTQHFAGNYSLQIQVPTDTSGNKERFEYVVAHASDTNGLHFDNARYCGFAFKLGSPALAFTSSDLFWQAWQGSPWGPPASLKLTADSSSPFTIGLYIRNMITGPDSANPDVKLWSSSMIQPDTWYSIVIYIAPRYTNNTGNIKLWINGTNFVDCTTNIGYDPNAVAGAFDGLDIKNGIYQPDANNGHTLYFDQIIFADSFAEAAAKALPTNTAPVTLPTNATILRNTFADVNLATLSTDAQTASTQLLFTVAATNGTATLLSDGHTARFTPASNFVGTAAYTYIARDMGTDPREFVRFTFEPPETLNDAFTTDNSGHLRDAQLQALGSGTFALATNTPFPNFSQQSLWLTKSGSTNAARLYRFVSDPAEMDFSDSNWTFAGWFQRAASTNHDFIFYIGNGDGFSGDGDELQLFCPQGNATLSVQHYNSNNVLDVNAVSAATVGTGEWHHVALTFQRTNSGAGILCGFLDGSQFVATNVAWALPQQTPIVFGGHNKTNANVNRWFGGCLDDLVLFTNALNAQEISQLASRTVSHFGGLSATNRISVVVTNYSAPRLASPTLTNGQWSMIINGDAGPRYSVQSSTDLMSWTEILSTNPLVSPFSFSTFVSNNTRAQFYRVVVGP